MEMPPLGQSCVTEAVKALTKESTCSPALLAGQALQCSWLQLLSLLFCFLLSRAKRKDLACSTAHLANTIVVTHSTALHHNTFFQWDFILDGTIFKI